MEMSSVAALMGIKSGPARGVYAEQLLIRGTAMAQGSEWPRWPYHVDYLCRGHTLAMSNCELYLTTVLFIYFWCLQGLQ